MAKQPEVADPSMRSVVNTNFGITNIVSMKESKQHILDVLGRCCDILTEHCGPKSGYAMLISEYGVNESFQPSIFTRDGIRILNSIDCISPLEKYIKNMLTYIGGRVDNYAKDGTTTSMLFAAAFLRKFLETYDTNVSLSGYTYSCIAKGIFDEVQKRIDNYKFTVESLCSDSNNEAEQIKAAGIIAFIQALSSSGGNIVLAKAMKAIFEASPKVSWEFISYVNSRKESADEFSVEVPEHDIKLKCSLGTITNGILNYALGTEYLDENVRVFIYSDALIHGSFKEVNVMEYFTNYPTDKPLVFITRSPDPNVVRAINDLNTKRQKPITLWVYMSDLHIAGVEYPWELMLANAICGCEPFDTAYASGKMTDAYTFVAKKIHFQNGYIYIYDTVEREPDSCLHPFYAHPEKATEYYKGVRAGLEDQIDLYTNGHNPNGDALKYFTEMLNRLACSHRPTLKLGGTVHDQVANADVVQDVLGAIMSSLKHGFTINGPLPLWYAIVSYYGELADRLEKNYSTGDGKFALPAEEYVRYVVAQSMVTGVSAVLAALYTGESKTKLTDSVTDAMKQDKNLYFNVLANSVCSLKEFVDIIDKDGRETDYPVAHPMAIYTEMLKRSKELLLKFINTNKIIVAGGVVVDDKPKK